VNLALKDVLGRQVSSGVYLVRLTVGNVVMNKRLVMVK
jgi:hypothetical protein